MIENLRNTKEQKEIEEALLEFKNNSGLTLESIYLANDIGEFYLYPFVDMPEDYDARTRSWYIQAMKEEIYISEIYEEVATGNQIITIAKKIDISDDMLGVIGIDVVVGKN